jgi:hypothetical protein
VTELSSEAWPASNAFADLSARLPDHVTRVGGLRTAFFDASWALGASFWEGVWELGQGYGTGDIEFVVLEPAPRYYADVVGIDGAHRIRATQPLESILNLMNAAPNGCDLDAYRFSARILVIASLPTLWGFWVDRNAGIGLLAFDQRPWMADWLLHYGPFMTAADTVELIDFNASRAAREVDLVQTFVETLSSNYPDHRSQ